MIEDKFNRERRTRQEVAVMEQKTLRENEEKLRRERENLMQKKKALADDLQEFLHSASSTSKKWQHEDEVPSSGLLTSPSAGSRDFLLQQRQYREALLKQISQERARRVEKEEEERRVEAASIRRLQEQNNVSASTSASLVHAQQSELRRSLLLQMREKLAQREVERQSKESDMAYVRREEARYQESMRQRLEHRKLQTKEMAETLERQLKRNEARHAEPTGTSLAMQPGHCELQSCGKCKRLVPRPYMTRPQWI